ncbi:helix-turn-helix transcriptional regulator [Halobacillus karajensis]|uniref:helix-turn-helix transcriptional regulator n=1 Tax=Halobacillus karajensis TaxID=195088 RepID=UPI00045CF2DC|nr:helix-turn-helix transcriptional regulator [Halobacillus karajensis]CDQ17980.1 addiction module antidote protein, HigA family [Halobacillus karajensis]
MAYKVGRCLLRDQLKTKGMTQQDLALKLDITVQQVNKYVTDRQRMSIQVAKNISEILGCHMEDLYEWIEAGTNN